MAKGIGGRGRVVAVVGRVCRSALSVERPLSTVASGGGVLGAADNAVWCSDESGGGQVCASCMAGRRGGGGHAALSSGSVDVP